MGLQTGQKWGREMHEPLLAQPSGGACEGPGCLDGPGADPTTGRGDTEVRTGFTAAWTVNAFLFLGKVEPRLLEEDTDQRQNRRVAAGNRA